MGQCWKSNPRRHALNACPVKKLEVTKWTKNGIEPVITSSLAFIVFVIILMFGLSNMTSFDRLILILSWLTI